MGTHVTAIRNGASRTLDPKLKRLIFSVETQPAALREIAGDEHLVASADDLPESPEPSDLSKRVMAKLVGTGPPSEFAGLRWTRLVDEIYTVTVPLDRLGALAAAPGVEFLSAGNALGPMLSTSLPEARADAATLAREIPPGCTGKGVVVGIVDFGLDYFLEDFRDANDTSRLAFFWNQGITPSPGESSPSEFRYGVEYDKAGIDQALTETGPGAPYSSVRPHRRDNATRPLNVGEHGTHVAGIAAGNGRTGDAGFPAGSFPGVAPESTLIFVQPDASDVASSFTDSVHVADAIRYIFTKAAEMGLPCVINMSLGQNGGSHDGESLVERAIDRMLEVEPGRAMVVAAGNEHVWRGHASGTLTTGDTRTLHWRVGGPSPISAPGATGNDVSHNEMEIWYSSRDRFRIRVIDPDGETTPDIEPGQTRAVTLTSGDTLFIDSVRFAPLNGASQIYIEAIPKPSGANLVQPLNRGVWRVEIEAVEARDGRFDAWIERDARRPSNQFADQSFFVGNDFDPVMTLGTPASTRRAVAVANYDHVSQAINDSSSRGPTRDGRPKPEVSAPGTRIWSSNSWALRKPPGAPNSAKAAARTIMSGTSMSAPHVAGIVALMLEVSPKLTTPQVTGILTAAARPPFGSDSTAIDPAFGFGRVDAVEAVRLAKELA